jgi:putative alpha-1,2-mannosidase
MFDKITIKLDPKYYKKERIVIERDINNDGKIKHIQLDGKRLNSFFVSHDDFVNGTTLKVIQN